MRRCAAAPLALLLALAVAADAAGYFVREHARASLASHAHEVRRAYARVFRGALVEMGEASADALRAEHGRDAVHPVREYSIASTVQDATGLWHLDALDSDYFLDGRFEYERNGTGVSVYALDSGVRADHDEFEGRAEIVYGSAEDGGDCNGHGTAVASLVAGQTLGVAKAARLRALRVLGCDGRTSTARVLDAMERIAEHGERPAVLLLTMASPFVDRPLDEAAASMSRRGYPIVASAGNDDRDACRASPSGSPGVLAVGAVDAGRSVAPFSRRGPCVPIYAPGVDVVAALHGSPAARAIGSGTSFSAPLVAGILATVLEGEPGLGPHEAYGRLYALAANASSTAGGGAPLVARSRIPPARPASTPSPDPGAGLESLPAPTLAPAPASQALGGAGPTEAAGWLWMAAGGGGFVVAAVACAAGVALRIRARRRAAASAPKGPARRVETPDAEIDVAVLEVRIDDEPERVPPESRSTPPGRETSSLDGVAASAKA